ncbi:hypothetical protein DB771_01770 [Burkholderia sp. AU29985]|nr:hypothetical protein DB771_01770 [Burkholderia sp. AU29985]
MLLAACCLLLAARCSPLAARRSPLAARCSPLAARRWPLAARPLPLAAYMRLPYARAFSDTAPRAACRSCAARKSRSTARPPACIR